MSLDNVKRFAEPKRHENHLEDFFQFFNYYFFFEKSYSLFEKRYPVITSTSSTRFISISAATVIKCNTSIKNFDFSTSEMKKLLFKM